MEPSWISVLPPVLAVVLAVVTRQVYLSLAGGVWFGVTVLSGWDLLAGLAGSIDRMVAVLGSEGDAKVLLFTLVIGALVTTIEVSGGVRGFVQWLEKLKWVDNARRSQLLAWAIGIVIFIESNITVLVAGTVARPLFDRFKVSREKLAYVIDSTSAPICILIPLNAWGAYNLGLLDELGVAEPLDVFLGSIPLNFYAIAAVILAFVTIRWKVDLGPMKRAEARVAAGTLHAEGSQPLQGGAALEIDPALQGEPRARDMLVPIAVMVGFMPLGLWITGDGNLLAGSGSTSVLWAVLAGLATAWIMLLARGALTVERLTHHGLKGAGGLLPLALILLLALTLGGVAKELGTGDYVAQLAAGRLPPVVLLPIIFIVAAGIAFSIGSSWGTFAIMLPIAIPTAIAMDLPLAPFVAASLSGGVFGDHASPISDTTVVASMAAATDHIEHVRTQLPYALLAGGVAAVAFAITGLLL